MKARSCIEGQTTRGTEIFVHWEQCFLWVLTGYGKSICFQTLPFLFDTKHGRTIKCYHVWRKAIVLIDWESDQPLVLRSLLARFDLQTKHIYAEQGLIHTYVLEGAKLIILETWGGAHLAWAGEQQRVL